MFFLSKEQSQALIKKHLEKRQKRSDAEEAERRKNYVCIIKKE